MKKRFFASCYIEDVYKKWCSKIPIDLQKEFEDDMYHADESIREEYEEREWERRMGEDL